VPGQDCNFVEVQTLSSAQQRTTSRAIRLITRRNNDLQDALLLSDKIYDEPIISIGSHPEATIKLDEGSLAPEQAVILKEDEGFFLINRAEGTYLNEEELAVSAKYQLSSKDRIQVGEYVILVMVNGELVAQADTLVEATEKQLLPEPLAPAKPPDRQHSFAAILESLRTSEDSYYFVIESEVQPDRRILVESAEMLLGWDAAKEKISSDPANINFPAALIRKNWAGVMVQPQTSDGIKLNSQWLHSTERLRDKDRLVFLETGLEQDGDETRIVQREVSLTFHEPASLIVLDSLLPNRLPPPVQRQMEAGKAAAEEPPQPPPDAKTNSRAQKLYFGYFTSTETGILAIGTLFLATLIFLILDNA
jgi:predicted component of type VI protein secretion system